MAKSESWVKILFLIPHACVNIYIHTFYTATPRDYPSKSSGTVKHGNWHGLVKYGNNALRVRAVEL